MKIGDHIGDRVAALDVRTGESRSFAALEARSNQIAHLFRALGVRHGGHIAILLENRLEYFDVVWAAQRAGIYYTPVNWHLSAAEATFIVQNCDASVLVTSPALLSTAASALVGGEPGLEVLVVGDETPPGAQNLEALIIGLPSTRVDDELEGAWMFYSSGTTGQPKGITPNGLGDPYGEEQLFDTIVRDQFDFASGMVFLSPAPLYHAAPLGWTMATQKAGGTVLVTDGFEPSQVLDLIGHHRVTHAQFVPTHFVRMLKLDGSIRHASDLSSLRVVVHAAAPCPVDVKQQMIEWFGPIIMEFYSGSEGVGFCQITSAEWLEHRGSVGRPAYGAVHILDATGSELPVGEVGEIWFETPTSFSYHGDAERTAQAWNDRGYGTFGDLGRVDQDGFLYLNDRRVDLVISGGVNLYPREAEDVLITHPVVDDVACLGSFDEDLGERLVAVVQTGSSAPATELAIALDHFVAQRLSRFKCPRAYAFVEELPRLPTGKLLKRKIDLGALETELVEVARGTTTE